MDGVNLAEAAAINDGAVTTDTGTGNRDDARAQVHSICGERTAEVQSGARSHVDGVAHVTEGEVIADDQRPTIDERATVVGVAEGEG